MAIYLVGLSNLLSRNQTGVVETNVEGNWLTMMSGFRRLCDLADGRTKEPGKYYDED